MVCLGNICRSPLAEGLMRKLAQQNNLNWEIASAGTAHWHEGTAPDSRSVAVAKNMGYDISAQRAKHFKASMFQQYDLIFVMDRNNLKDVINLATNTEERKKVKLFLDNDEVIDPYYDNSLFEPVCKQIENRCKELITQLTSS
jgi:protein-tyrosine phosphatase